MSENREEFCWRIGGPVYMRKDKPCPECGARDTHIPSSELREERDQLRADLAAKTAQAEAWKEAAEYAYVRVLGIFARQMTIEQARSEFMDLSEAARSLESGETEGTDNE